MACEWVEKMLAVSFMNSWLMHGCYVYNSSGQRGINPSFSGACTVEDLTDEAKVKNIALFPGLDPPFSHMSQVCQQWIVRAGVELGLGFGLENKKKIKRRSKEILSLWWQTWTSFLFLLSFCFTFKPSRPLFCFCWTRTRNDRGLGKRLKEA